MSYKVGTRVKLSDDAKTHGVNPRNPDREGVVIGHTHRLGTPAMLIRWDGLKGTQTLKWDFVSETLTGENT